MVMMDLLVIFIRFAGSLLVMMYFLYFKPFGWFNLTKIDYSHKYAFNP